MQKELNGEEKKLCFCIVKVNISVYKQMQDLVK